MPAHRPQNFFALFVVFMYLLKNTCYYVYIRHHQTKGKIMETNQIETLVVSYMRAHYVYATTTNHGKSNIAWKRMERIMETAEKLGIDDKFAEAVNRFVNQ